MILLRTRTVCCLLSLLLLLLAPGPAGEQVALAQQSPDLCAIFPHGSGLRVQPAAGEGGNTVACQLYDERPANAHKFYVVSIKSYSSISGTQAQMRSYAAEKGWQPYTGIGDPGFAYQHPSNPGAGNNEEYNRLTFSRNCYVFFGDAGSEMLGGAQVKYNDLSGVLEIARAVDTQLAGLPCQDTSGAAGGAGDTGGASPTVEAAATDTPVPTDTPVVEPTAPATPTSDVDLRIHHIEVVQVVQTFDNQIPLVAGKKTVVRVFVTTSGPAGKFVPGVTALVTIWPEGKDEVALTPANGPLTTVVGVEPDGNIFDSSINFLVPDNLTAAGVFSVKAVVNPDHAVPETDYSNNEHTEPLEFVQRNGLRIGYVRIGYKPPLESTFSWPKSDLTKYDPLLRKLLPAPDAGIQYYEMPWRVRTTRSASTGSLGTDLNLDLRDFYDHLGPDRPDILIGWLSTDYTSSFEYGGLAEAAEPGQLGHVALVLDYQSTYSEKTLAHEVGHDLGLKHTGTKSDPPADCTISANGDSGYWPPEYGDSAAIRVPGFDTTTMQVIPSSYYDIMSYCGVKRWITPFHYQKLFDQNVKPAADFTSSTIDNIIVRGWGWVRGGGGTPRFELVRPAAPDVGGTRPASPPQALAVPAGWRFGLQMAGNLLNGGAAERGGVFTRVGTGSYCLRFLDASGAALYERCFEPAFADQESLQPSNETGFVLEVPNPGNFTRVAVMHDENGQAREVAALTKSSQAPTVTISAPKSGDRWQGEQTITWAVSGGVGGGGGASTILRYDILYSPDAKKSWYPLQVNSSATSYTFSTDEILPSDQTYIRVLASDGFSTTHADVGPLVVPQQANSPAPPPAAPAPGGNASATAGGPGAAGSGTPGPQLPGGALALCCVALLAALLALVVFAVARSSRRRPQVSTAGPIMVPTGYAQAAPGRPASAPPSLAYPTAPNPFQRLEMERARLHGEWAAGRIAPQQFEAAVRALSLRDAHGRYWMLDATSGRWLVWNGSAWVWAQPDPYG